MTPWGMVQLFGQPNNNNAAGAGILSKLGSWWEMDEPSGVRYDLTGANHLSVVTTVATAAGVRGTDVSASFNGGGALQVASNPSLQVPAGGGAHCIFGWAYLTALQSNNFLFAKWDAGSSSSLEYQSNASNANLYAGDGGSNYQSAGNAPVTTGNWYFVVMWRDPADGKVRMQINDNVTYVSSGVSNPSPNSNPLSFGQAGSYNGFRLQGRLQRWGWIKGAILTPEERTWLYNSGASRTWSEIVAADTTAQTYDATVLADSPAGYWKFNETSGTTAADSSGNGHDGSIVGTPALSASGITLNGTSQFVTMSAAAFNVIGAASQPFTFEILVTPLTGIGTNAALVDKSNISSPVKCNLLQDNGNAPHLQLYNGSTNPIAAGSTMAADMEVMLHAVRDTTAGTLSLYKNGALVTSVSDNNLDYSNAIALCFGARQAGVDRFAKVKIRRGAVYLSALSPTRIAAHFKARNQ